MARPGRAPARCPERRARLVNGTIAAQLILLAVALAFVCAAARRYLRDGRRVVNATRTWLIVAAIFTLVSGWLFLANPGR